MSDDVFGVGLGHDEDLPDFVKEEPQATDAATEVTQDELYPHLQPKTPETPETAPEPAEGQERARDEKGRFLPKQEPTAPVVEGQGEPAPEGLDQASEEAQKAWAGKYQTPEALEKGYRELRDLQRRTAERAKAYEQRNAEVEFQARQMEQAVQRATEYVRSLQQQQQGPPPVLYDQEGNPVQLPPQGLSPQQVQEMVAAQTNEALAYQAQAQQEQSWRAQQYAEAQQAQSTFFETHPDIEKGGDVDNDIASTILAFNEAWTPMDGSSFNLGSEESLAIAYEASQRPALRTVLMKSPQFMDDDEGMTLARALANQIDQAGTTQMASQTPGRMTARPNTPFAERGSSPSPQQASPMDEFDQAVAEYRGRNKARGSKVLFGE